MTQTKAELEAIIAKQEEEIETLKDLIETKLAALEHPINTENTLNEYIGERHNPLAGLTEPPDGGGWIIRTANDTYSGKTYGIKFVSGVAVLDKKQPNASKIAKQIKADFGYSVMIASANDMNSMRAWMLEMMSNPDTQQTVEQKLMRPNYAGMVR